MSRLLNIVLTITILFVLGTGTALAKYKRIAPHKSPFDVRIENIDNSLLRYFNGGWNDQYTIERHAIYFRDHSTDRYLSLVLVTVANDEFYWGSAPEVTVDTIKRRRYFRNKEISVTFESDGVNAGMDTAAGEPSYLLFKADNQECAYVRRISAFGPHGGTSVPYIISGYYCVPHGERLTKGQAKAIAEKGLIFKGEPGAESAATDRQTAKLVEKEKETAKKSTHGAEAYTSGTYLTADQVKKLYAGAEFKGTSRSGDPAHVKYHADGTYKVDINGRSMSGKWRVKESGEYCFENDNGATGCWLTKYLGENRYQNLNDKGRTRIQTLISRLEDKPGKTSGIAAQSIPSQRTQSSSVDNLDSRKKIKSAMLRPPKRNTEMTKLSEFDGRWIGTVSAIKISLEINSGDVEGQLICDRSSAHYSGNQPVSHNTSTEIKGEIKENKILFAETTGAVGRWGYREIRGKLPRLKIWDVGVCGGGEVVMSRVQPGAGYRLNQPEQTLNRSAVVISGRGLSPNGELSATQIKGFLVDKLLEGRESFAIVGRDYDHSQDEDCWVSHKLNSNGTIRTTCVSSLGSDEQIGNWSVDKDNMLCMKWPSWFEGKQHCSRVKVTGKLVTLTARDSDSTIYALKKN